MNEELQSTNQELETMNEELRHRSVELNDTNTVLDIVLSRIGLAVIVLDRKQNIRIWNSQARELWGLSAEEVEGENLFSLDIGLPAEQLRPQLRAIFAGTSDREEVTLGAVNRRGRRFDAQVTFLRLGGLEGDGPGAAIMMIDGESG